MVEWKCSTVITDVEGETQSDVMEHWGRAQSWEVTGRRGPCGRDGTSGQSKTSVDKSIRSAVSIMGI